MKLSDFILLGDKDKETILLNNGVLVAKRRSGGSMIFLFRLHSLYAELVCNINSKGVEEFRALTSEKLLQPYLEAISLDGLEN